MPRAANHALSVMSKLLTWAEDQGYRPEGANPCQRVQRYRENKRERFLTKDELAKLGKALDKAEAEHIAGPYAIAALRLLIFTGARLNEILTLQWSHVDLERKMIFLPDSKTGQKPVTLNQPAIDILKALPRFANNPYVIVGHRYGSHLINLQKPWQEIRALAGLETVRIHDLRHTFASVAVATGNSDLKCRYCAVARWALCHFSKTTDIGHGCTCHRVLGEFGVFQSSQVFVVARCS